MSLSGAVKVISQQNKHDFPNDGNFAASGPLDLFSNFQRHFEGVHQTKLSMPPHRTIVRPLALKIINKIKTRLVGRRKITDHTLCKFYDAQHHRNKSRDKAAGWLRLKNDTRERNDNEPSIYLAICVRTCASASFE